MLSNIGVLVNNIDQLDTTAVNIFLGILLAVVICAIVINSISIRAWRKDKTRFAKLVPSILASIILSFACLAGSIVLAVITSSIFTTLYCVYEVMFSIASIVLLIVDLALEKKRVQKIEKVEINQIENEISEKNSDVEEKIQQLFDLKSKGLISEEEYISLKSIYFEENPKQKAEKKKTALELKIEKIEDMKNRGLITEKEFKALKLKYIEESL